MGGLMTMLIAMKAPERLAGVVLNDIGTRLERAGLEAQLAGPEGPRDPIHAAVRIERALGLGGVEEAGRLLEEAERRWPGDEAWPELRGRLALRSAAGEGEARSSSFETGSETTS